MSSDSSIIRYIRYVIRCPLLKSLDSIKQAEIDALWAEEADKRVQAIEQGQVTLIPGEQVFRSLRSRSQ